MQKSLNICNPAIRTLSVHKTYVAGIILTASEVKDIWNARVSLKNAYCRFDGNILLSCKLKTHSTREAERVLLLNARELDQIRSYISNSFGCLISRIVNAKNLIKIEISICKSDPLKKKRAPKENLKDIRREIGRFSVSNIKY